MGTVYARGKRLWIGYKDADGARKYAPTKFTVGQESKAGKLLDAIERRIQAAANFEEAALGPLTVKRYLARWIQDRRLRNVASAGDDETRLQRHALPELGELLLAEVRPSHIRALIRSLKAKVGQGRAQLAPRTVRHVYGVLHRMFEDAVADELIESNPCSIKRGELPSKIDKDPTWRSGAVFTRDEVEQLISDERIPEDRRVFYAIAFWEGFEPEKSRRCAFAHTRHRSNLSVGSSWRPHSTRVHASRSRSRRASLAKLRFIQHCPESLPLGSWADGNAKWAARHAPTTSSYQSRTGAIATRTSFSTGSAATARC